MGPGCTSCSSPRPLTNHRWIAVSVAYMYDLDAMFRFPHSLCAFDDAYFPAHEVCENQSKDWAGDQDAKGSHVRNPFLSSSRLKQICLTHQREAFEKANYSCQYSQPAKRIEYAMQDFESIFRTHDSSRVCADWCRRSIEERRADLPSTRLSDADVEVVSFRQEREQCEQHREVLIPEELRTRNEFVTAFLRVVDHRRLEE